MQPFCIALFQKTNEVEYVPTTWVSATKNTVHGPSGHKNITAITDKLTPPTDDWTSFEMQVLCFAGNNTIFLCVS